MQRAERYMLTCIEKIASRPGECIAAKTFDEAGSGDTNCTMLGICM